MARCKSTIHFEKGNVQSSQNDEAKSIEQLLALLKDKDDQIRKQKRIIAMTSQKVISIEEQLESIKKSIQVDRKGGTNIKRRKKKKKRNDKFKQPLLIFPSEGQLRKKRADHFRDLRMEMEMKNVPQSQVRYVDLTSENAEDLIFEEVS